MTAQDMTIAEAAKAFGIKHRTLWKAVADKRVPARKSGYIWLIDKHALCIAIITGRVKVDKALVDQMVEEYLAPPQGNTGAIGAVYSDETGTDMGGGRDGT